MIPRRFAPVLVLAVVATPRAWAAPACPNAGNGTQVEYAKAVPDVYGWNYVEKAVGSPNDTFATLANMPSVEALVGQTFDFCAPPGTGPISQVLVAIKHFEEKTNPASTLKLGCLGKAATVSNEASGWDELDVTDRKASWNWDDVRALKVSVDRAGHPSTNGQIIANLDAFRVTVRYALCTPGASASCDPRADGVWLVVKDSCGKVTAETRCADGNPCTADVCDAGAKACGYPPDPGSEACCNSVMTIACHEGNRHHVNKCGQVKDLVEACTDEDPCTKNGCDAASAACTVEPDTWNEACCDTGFATQCRDGRLVKVDKCGHEHEVLDPCTDSDDCTLDGCDPVAVACTHVKKENCPCAHHASLKCNGNQLFWYDSCLNLEEVADTCDDGEPCTVDGCDPVENRCFHTPSLDPTCVCKIKHFRKVCDANQLFWADNCGNKQVDLADDCNDHDVCTVDSCVQPDPAEDGACVHTFTPNPGCCEPAHQEKVCKGAAVVWADACGQTNDVIASCDDLNPCTADACDTATAACSHEPILDETCCPPHAKKKCQDGVLVSFDGCGRPEPLPDTCDDGDICTLDGCSVDQCTHTVDLSRAECACKGKQTLECRQGKLSLVECDKVLSVADDCSDSNPCTVDGCDDAKCTHTPEGAPPECDPCFAGTSAKCSGGHVVWVDGCGVEGVVAVDCDDDDPCTDDSCEPLTASCRHAKSAAYECKDAPDPAACQGAVTLECADGSLVFRDACGRRAGIAATCADGDACTVDGCEDGACTHVATGLPECAGAKPCSGVPVSADCREGSLVFLDECDHVTGVKEVCVDADPCTADRCDEDLKACVFEPAGDGTCTIPDVGPADALAEPGPAGDTSDLPDRAEAGDATKRPAGKAAGGCQAGGVGLPCVWMLVGLLLLAGGLGGARRLSGASGKRPCTATLPLRTRIRLAIPRRCRPDWRR